MLGNTHIHKGKSMRSEQQIFDDLAAVAAAPGFVYAIAAVYLRDNAVIYKDEIEPEDMAPFFSTTRLIRNEVMTLIGLMMRVPIDFTMPTYEIVQNYIQRAEQLLEELHQKFDEPIGEFIQPNAVQPASNPFESAKVLRESIFYAAESAYPFQYRDLAPRKYKSDAAWLLQDKGINLQVAAAVCRALVTLFSQRLIETGQKLAEKPPSEQTLLSATLDMFTFSPTELAAHTGHSIGAGKAVLDAFALPDGESNDCFTSLDEFNSAYAYPFIRKGNEYLLLQPYGIWETLYDTPYYWMSADQSYAPTAFGHRGNFTEEFASECLVRVFGEARVFRNVDIYKSKRKREGEIDTLVLFGDRAIVLQAKSKKLTLEARKGNDHQLQEDFKAAVQNAVNQAFACAELLGDPSVVVLRTRDGTKVPMPQPWRCRVPAPVLRCGRNSPPCVQDSSACRDGGNGTARPASGHQTH